MSEWDGESPVMDIKAPTSGLYCACRVVDGAHFPMAANDEGEALARGESLGFELGGSGYRMVRLHRALDAVLECASEMAAM